jgi:hypothetical protein
VPTSKLRLVKNWKEVYEMQSKTKVHRVKTLWCILLELKGNCTK